MSWAEFVAWPEVLITLHQPGSLPSKEGIGLFLPTWFSSPTRVCTVGAWMEHDGFVCILAALTEGLRGWVKGIEVVPC